MTVVLRAATDQGLLALQRQLRALAPEIALVTNGDQALEHLTPDARPPRLVDADVIEAGVQRARRVFGEPEVAFAAFLDGTQTSRVVAYIDGTPIIHGTVAAVVRIRRNRRLATWHRPIVRRRLYACLRAFSPERRRTLQNLGLEVVDTTPASQDAPAHPFILRDEAVHRVQDDREEAERELAERWCNREKEPLFIDGGISGSDKVAVSSCTVGVVKSHRTLYAEGDALQAILALRRGERSSVFRVTSPKRVPVASWYLRLRDPLGYDPMWGLVRVEIAHPAHIEVDLIGARADQISLWIFAETSPLALPDGRWDKMVYGIHDCEAFLDAVT
ncbi:MAG TPA: hypothetical protein VJN70_13265 [Gemmatimonadaceae bacterium]|nr:hypothetical protein [Gemmatimonadaceae bacterium]